MSTLTDEQRQVKIDEKEAKIERLEEQIEKLEEAIESETDPAGKKLLLLIQKEVALRNEKVALLNILAELNKQSTTSQQLQQQAALQRPANDALLPPQAREQEQDSFLILKDVAEKIEAPSTFGRGPVMNTPTRSRIQSWRPPREGVLPVVLVCEAFSEFVGDARSVKDVEPCDCECVRSLAETMPGKFGNEKERESVVHAILAKLLDRDFTRPMHIDTDGSVLYNPIPGDQARQAMLLNLEVKKEKGSTSSDCGVQNIAYFVKYWGAGAGRNYCSSTSLPTLLLQVEGPTIFCSGAVFHGDRVCVDPLSPAFHMLELRHDESSMLQLAALMRAIRLCVPRLIKIYEDAVPVRGGKRQFPYVTEVLSIDGSETVKFQYVARLENKLAFECVGNEDASRLLVKFSPWGYSMEAHQALAEANFAPRLRAIKILPCGMTMAVMDFVEHVGHNMSEWDVAWMEQLRLAVKVLHNKSLVHGDLRKMNLLFSTGKRLLLVDFDFSGEENVARYPWALTTNGIQWPAGVAPRAVLKKEHDLEMMTRLLQEADDGSRKRILSTHPEVGNVDQKRQKN